MDLQSPLFLCLQTTTPKEKSRKKKSNSSWEIKYSSYNAAKTRVEAANTTEPLKLIHIEEAAAALDGFSFVLEDRLPLSAKTITTNFSFF